MILAVGLKDTERILKLLSWQYWCHNLAPNDIDLIHALPRLQIRVLGSNGTPQSARGSLLNATSIGKVW